MRAALFLQQNCLIASLLLRFHHPRGGDEVFVSWWFTGGCVAGGLWRGWVHDAAGVSGARAEGGIRPLEARPVGVPSCFFPR